MVYKWLILIFILTVDSSVAQLLNTVVNIFENVTNSINVTNACSVSLKKYVENLQTPLDDPWALRMLDATSKIPPGILYSYNFGEMGNFKQCLETRSKDNLITAKYCLGTISFTTDSASQYDTARIELGNLPLLTNTDLQANVGVSPTWALCLPSNCTQNDVFEIMNSTTNSIGITGIQFTSFTCQTMEEDINVPLSDGAIITICVLLFIVLLMVICTIYDIHCVKKAIKPYSLLYTSFSVYSNGKSLLKTTNQSTDISCLNGMRFLSMVWVVSDHTFSLYTSGPLSNLKDYLEWTNSLESMIMVTGALSVDTFLVVGGALVVYTFIKRKVAEIKFNLFQYYIHRYIRLTPALAAVALVSATLIEYMGSGPKWGYIKSNFAYNCKVYWWSTLLYVQNYVNVDTMCVGQSWYLNIDMQLYLISPLILLILWKYPKAGGGFVVLCVIVFVVTPFYVAYAEELAALQTNFYLKTPRIDYMNHYYLKTHTRAAPWFVGIFLGHVLSGVKFRNFKTHRLNKAFVLVIWAICLTLIFTCIFSGYGTLRGPNFDRLGNAFFIALVRPVWSLCVAWVIWACAMGYASPVNTFLSLPLFQILNRFTYSIYIIHVTLLFMIVFSGKTAVYFTPFNMAYLFWGIYMFTLAISIFWTLAFESPTINLEKVLYEYNKK